ncbi:hypothetical protein D9M68_276350 [compost metagenome]
MAFDFLQQGLQFLNALFGSEARLQDGEHVVAEARQMGVAAEVGAQQVGQVGEQQVDAGQADVGEQRRVAVDAHIGEAGRLAGVDRTFGGAVEQFEEVVAVVQAGDQVLAADFAQLFFQLRVVALGADHHLDAGLAVVAGRREAHARLEALAVGLDAAAGQFVGAFAALVALQEVLELALVGGGDQVDHRHAFQFVGVLVVEHLQVGAVGVDVHAVVHVGDGIDRAVEQQLAAFFRLAQGHFGGAAGAAFVEVGQFAVGHQDQPLVLALRQGVLGAEGQGLGDGVGVVAGDQLQHRDVLGLAADRGDRFAGLEVVAARRADQQVPALLQGFGEVVTGGDAVYAGGPPGVAEQADEPFGFVLRVFENQQADGLFFDGHEVCLQPVLIRCALAKGR